jgi:hypothetical protein
MDTPLRRNPHREGGGPYVALVSGEGMQVHRDTFPSIKQALAYADGYREADTCEVYDRNEYIVRHYTRQTVWVAGDLADHPHVRPAPIMPVSCPKCEADCGDDWSECDGDCPMLGSPHFSPSTSRLFAQRGVPVEFDPI